MKGRQDGDWMYARMCVKIDSRIKKGIVLIGISIAITRARASGAR